MTTTTTTTTTLHYHHPQSLSGTESAYLLFLVMLSERNNLSEKFLRSCTFMRALSPVLGETSKVVCDCRSRKKTATANHRGYRIHSPYNKGK
jgi:hypothetical protein